MKIQKLKPSRINNRINVIFDDNSYLPLFVDDVVKNNLKIGYDVDYSLLKDLSTKYLVKEYALRQIALSPKTAIILKRKIQQKFRDFNPDEIIENLKPYLNEQKFIEYFINKFKKKSNREIEYRLKMLGIKYHSTISDLEKIKNLIKKKKNISISALIARGFAYSDIKSVFANLE